MTYKISICYPDKEEIELQSETINSKKALDFFTSHPWIEQIELSNNTSQEVYYSPSIRFTNKMNKRSLELTAAYEDDKLMFSLWYERPVMTKIFFGLFGEKEISKVIDKWSFDKETSCQHLNIFLEGRYDEMERIMRK